MKVSIISDLFITSNFWKSCFKELWLIYSEIKVIYLKKSSKKIEMGKIKNVNNLIIFILLLY